MPNAQKDLKAAAAVPPQPSFFAQKGVSGVVKWVLLHSALCNNADQTSVLFDHPPHELAPEVQQASIDSLFLIFSMYIS